ncbi:MAG: glycosyltransferase family 4 protein [Alphaproteobacteria bacterium]
MLYLCRVFSGFETSLERRRWQPTGAPTIYRVIEALDRTDHEVTFLMTCRGVGADYRTDWTDPADREVELEGLSRPVHVLASEHRYPAWLGRLRGPLTNLRHLWRTWRTVRKTRPDLVYVDRSNVLAGALIARLTRIPVVLRVMGVYPSMWDALTERSRGARVARWAYRAPFALALCTQDGSGGERWLPEALHPGTPFRMLLNGFDGSARSAETDPRFEAIPADKTIVLFVGRFESIKGCEEFADALIQLHAEGRQDIHAVMIGTGRLRDGVQTRVTEAGAADMFTFIDRLNHDQVPEAHRRSDIYVSLNRLGQLSNANLEAMSMGACMIVPAAQPERGIDLATEALVDESAVLRLPWVNQTDALADALRTLTSDPERRNALRANMKATADKLVQSWDARVAEEFALIGELTGRKP